MFLPLLAALFIGLKLTHHVEWSWWVVLLPTFAHVFIVALYVAVKVLERVMNK